MSAATIPAGIPGDTVVDAMAGVIVARMETQGRCDAADLRHAGFTADQITAHQDAANREALRRRRLDAALKRATTP